MSNDPFGSDPLTSSSGDADYDDGPGDELVPPAVGSRVLWRTWGGSRYAGVVTEVDNEDVVVMCDDGVERVTYWE